PVSDSGEYWTDDDIKYGTLEEYTKTLIQIDPAVTNKKSSHFTAFAAISYRPGFRRRDNKSLDRMPMCVVRHVEAVRVPPAILPDRVLRPSETFPEDGGVRVEVNHGGGSSKSVFHNLPVPMVVHRQSIPNHIRAERLLNHCQRNRALHANAF